nr:MAG TPA: hypothetical protein [Caudoviricetes sp.]DAY02561.1 MAG TPA: hypothetical protein [Caudoviricetes sp.]
MSYCPPLWTSSKTKRKTESSITILWISKSNPLQSFTPSRLLQ